VDVLTGAQGFRIIEKRSTRYIVCVISPNELTRIPMRAGLASVSVRLTAEQSRSDFP
jgi:hypothetical protein